jgi:predicted RNA binding protein YcfA (HicA-like mRNA interferase family)
MPKLPILSGKNMARVLAQNGFVVCRQSSSHILLEHPDGKITTIPVHGNKDLPKGTIRGILRDIEMTPEQFRNLL